MKITTENFYDTVLKGQIVFYKASQSGVEECKMVCDTKGNFIGFTCGVIFTAVELVKSHTWVFDTRGAEYHDNYDDAVLAHRGAVIAYLDQLNSSTLKHFPILYGNPIYKL